jgi:hypothetical protein
MKLVLGVVAILGSQSVLGQTAYVDALPKAPSYVSNVVDREFHINKLKSRFIRIFLDCHTLVSGLCGKQQ